MSYFTKKRATTVNLRYKRNDLTVGIAHFGVGNFHRAHQAIYIDELLSRGLARDWGICGVGVLPGDTRMRDALVDSDFQYTHVERSASGKVSARQVGAIVDYLFAPDDPEAVLQLLTRPQIRIVSLTITEGGYNTSAVSGRFDAEAPAIVADLRNVGTPATVFGLVTEALTRRRASGIPPFTVMSCDNLQGNGEVARGAFVAFARLRDPELGAWVAENVAFPSSMVDRITPATSEQDRQFVRETFGTTDPWPVLSEDYIQWVAEDHFPLGRPPLELVGVQLVDDVAPYEQAKLRLLNASHQVLTYFGLLLGYDYVHEAANDPLISRFLKRYLLEEAIPSLDPIDGFDQHAYAAVVVERFRNPHVRDALTRIATDATDRITTFLLPVIADAVAKHREAPMSAAAIASWAVSCTWPGRPSEITDRQHELVDAALANGLTAFLYEHALMGDLGDSMAFRDAFLSAHQLIISQGARAALDQIVRTA